MNSKQQQGPIQGDRCGICVPIVGPTVEDILSQVQEAVKAKVDLIELRPDMWMKGSHLHEEEYIPTIVNLVEEVHSRYEKMSILFTWRTLAEGGETSLSNENYGNLLQAIVDQNVVDAVDVELFTYTDTIGQIIKEAHHQGIQTVMSYHNFHKTLNRDTLHLYAERMISAGAAVIKFALMPTTSDDVLSVLQFTKELTERYPQLPRITMSMGKLGQMTRTCGHVFGNCLTFGTLGQASAPGQVEVAVLKQLV
ncbi:type I 3-dehydroquinate dehydratase [Veillonella sp. DNF00869]|uniref:type I 3-dehydroquinate dehydratase n=1 Tax=Veillonella sp. DNF00869 TaxID=1384081 RepID=UPI0007843FAF|nr:type I 3-dehydroquinate dehydratase [Veillonella sp. DNF00869]KXB87224.1 3-dehydroquinate dehydratase, type I [Veillonella sp. DNF00869]